MDIETIIKELIEKHNSFIDYINNLTSEEYFYRFEQKWTAEQQLEHIVLCTQPLLQVYSMEKSMIEKHFGKTERQGNTYKTLLENYKQKLNEGGKAPERFVPTTSEKNSKEILTSQLTKTIADLCAAIKTFEDKELDRLLIPHPLLGNLTLREMLYNAIQHVIHHHQATKQNLLNTVL